VTAAVDQYKPVVLVEYAVRSCLTATKVPFPQATANHTVPDEIDTDDHVCPLLVEYILLLFLTATKRVGKGDKLTVNVVSVEEITVYTSLIAKEVMMTFTFSPI
jgi:hypothetical protein